MLAPGQSSVVPLRLMDGAPNADLTRLVARDAAERTRARLHRPGFRLQPDAAARARSWLRTKPTKIRSVGRGARRRAEHGSSGSRSDQREEGDACVIGGMAGTLVETGDGLVCIPNEWEAADAAPYVRSRGRPPEYIDRISNAWRNSDGDVVPDRGPVQSNDGVTMDEIYAEYDRELAASYRKVKP